MAGAVGVGRVCTRFSANLRTPTRTATSSSRSTFKYTAGRRAVHSAASEGGAGSEAHPFAGAPPRQAGLPDSVVLHRPGSPNDSPESTAPVTATLEVVPEPGQDDDRWFEQHWTVGYWRDQTYRPKEDMADLRELVSAAAESARQANVLQDTMSAAYWAYHSARWFYFLTQAAASVFLTSARTGDLAKGKVTYIFDDPLDRTSATQITWNTTSEAFNVFQCDLRNIKDGAYKLPWDMTTPGHRQYNPLHVLRQSMLYLQEAPQVLGRRRAPEGQVGLLPFGRSPLYPDYYQNNFHFQTDGWFSSRSADTYDVANETLFAGRQDAVQRSTLLAMNRHFPGSNGAGLEVLEVGAGTGRVATFVRDNYPAARLTVSDLSPFYLEKAASAMAYWERCVAPSVRSAGSVAFLQCAAEALPQADASTDVVYSVYMFHEMPAAARRAALREFARVLRPGGVLIITDSAQEGDRKALDNLRVLEGLNEPHYGSYLDFSFGPLLDEAGLQPCFKSLSSSTKTLSAVKR